jgi:hypothetical protein
MNLEGIGMPRDVAGAYWWFRKAADKDDGEAQFALGEMYESGESVASDMDEAIRWYWKAAGNAVEAAKERLRALNELGAGGDSAQ